MTIFKCLKTLITLTNLNAVPSRRDGLSFAWSCTFEHNGTQSWLVNIHVFIRGNVRLRNWKLIDWTFCCILIWNSTDILLASRSKRIAEGRKIISNPLLYVCNLSSMIVLFCMLLGESIIQRKWPSVDSSATHGIFDCKSSSVTVATRSFYPRAIRIKHQMWEDRKSVGLTSSKWLIKRGGCGSSMRPIQSVL